MSNDRLAPRMSVIGVSPTAEISNKVRALRAGGFDVVNLGEGELDFATPKAIADAGIEAIRRGETKYTAVAGTAALKAAIVKKFKSVNGLDLRPNEVIAGTGAKQLIFNAFFATLSEGDEVIVPAPYWVSYPDMIRLAGGKLAAVETKRNNRWILQPQDLEAAITPNTRWVVLNSPSNPTGAVYSADELKALTDVLLRHPHVLLMADDIYEPIIYTGSFVTPAAVEPKLADRTLTINGLSKGFSMTGWRLGYAGGPEWLVTAMDMLQSQSTANPCSISQAAAVVALRDEHDFLPGWIKLLEERRSIVMDMIDKANGLEADLPEGAFYVFASCSALLGKKTQDGKVISSDLDVASYLLDEARVGVVHGQAFGMPGHIRFAYGVDTDVLRGACDRVVSAINKLS
ncbi:pyridoxal phosphate-dependent aminotransferase [Brucella intermedia]|uniref:pyridoxal phosphate-dependent aminotransferase n=1 Tax=Brucella intermedia TaxID=94625 RepID=UPI00396A4947